MGIDSRAKMVASVKLTLGGFTAMAKHERVDVTMDDVLDYQDALQTLYGVDVVVELGVGKNGTHGKWILTAKAFQFGGLGENKLVSFYTISYPTYHHKTFPGAILGSVMRLEQQLQAWYFLQHGGPPEGA